MRQLLYRFSSFLEKTDPYYTQRIIFRKALFISVCIIFFYVIIQPKQGLLYIYAPYMLFIIYEWPTFHSFHEKFKALIFGFVIATFLAGLFYLLFPFHLVLLLVSGGLFLGLYFFCIKRYKAFRPFVNLIFVVAVAHISTQPEASIEGLKSILFAIVLSMLITVVAYKVHQNLYDEVWIRSLKISTLKILNNLGCLLNDEHHKYDPKVYLAVNVMFEYKRLVNAKGLLNKKRISIAIRNINMITLYLRNISINETYWVKYKECLSALLNCIDTDKVYDTNLILHQKFHPENSHQKLGLKYLNATVKNWNKLCIAG